MDASFIAPRKVDAVLNPSVSVVYRYIPAVGAVLPVTSTYVTEAVPPETFVDVVAFVAKLALVATEAKPALVA